MSQSFLYSDIAPPHPGEILREDLLPALDMTRAELAQHLHISQRALTDLLAERRPVTLDLAMRLGTALGQGARYWLGLQIQYDLWHAARAGESGVTPIARARWRKSASAWAEAAE